MHRKPTRHDVACGIARPVVCTVENLNGIRDRIIAEDPGGGRRKGGGRAAYAIDVGRSALGKHAASHVVHLPGALVISGCLDRPRIGVGVILKRMHEIAVGQIGGATAHGIKLPVGREKDAHQSNPDAREARRG
jgi:hypothetical protein